MLKKTDRLECFTRMNLDINFTREIGNILVEL
jgi:hypothetical protein